jgi:hypothetical protein
MKKIGYKGNQKSARKFSPKGSRYFSTWGDRRVYRKIILKEILEM